MVKFWYRSTLLQPILSRPVNKRRTILGNAAQIAAKLNHLTVATAPALGDAVRYVWG